MTTQIWCIDGGKLKNEDVPFLEAKLSQEQRKRLASCKIEKTFHSRLRSQLLLTALQRYLLQTYKQVSEEDLEILYGVHGKPYFKKAIAAFNITNAKSISLLAFTTVPGAQIGIDLEFNRESTEKIVNRFFTDREKELLEDSRQNVLFTDLWTRKESVLKAKGCGLTFPLNAFDVTDPVCASVEGVCYYYKKMKIPELGPEAMVHLATDSELVLDDIIFKMLPASDLLNL